MLRRRPANLAALTVSELELAFFPTCRNPLRMASSMFPSRYSGCSRMNSCRWSCGKGGHTHSVITEYTARPTSEQQCSVGVILSCHLEVVGHPRTAMAVVNAEERQLGILLQVRECRASGIKRRSREIESGKVLKIRPFSFVPPKKHSPSTNPVNSDTPHQKRTQDRFGIPATIPVPYEPPGSGLSENMKMKKIYRGTLTSDFSKTSFFIEIHID